MIDFTKPVRTKSGRAVRILCTDGPEPEPIIGIVSDIGSLLTWRPDGRFMPGRIDEIDLENVSEETFVWLNVYLVDGRLTNYGNFDKISEADSYPMRNRVGRIKVKLEARFDD